MEKIIGMIGLGNMGHAMVENLAARGFRCIGADAIAKQSDDVVEVVEIPALVECADVILMSLPNSKIIESVVFGENGLLGIVPAGKTVIDMSSADPASTRKIHAALKERNVGYLDAAVSGGKGKAANGTLAIMVGGDKDVYEANCWLLHEMGAQVTYMGLSGSGDAMKAVNNFLTGVTLAATSEAMIVAKKMGLDLEQVLDVLNKSSGESYATSYRFPKIIKGDYIEGGLSSKLMIKDLEVFRSCAQSVDASVIMGDVTTSVFRLANGVGKGDLVSNRIVDVLGDLSGGVRLCENKREKGERI